MTPPSIDPPDSRSSLGGLDPSTVSHLLDVAASPSVRPADALAMRLEGEDGHRFADSVFANCPIDGLDSTTLLTQQVDVEQLKKLHRAGRRQFHDARSDDEHHAGLFWYLAAIGLALVDHDLEISSQPRHEVVEAVLVLADALDDPWHARLEAVGQ